MKRSALKRKTPMKRSPFGKPKPFPGPPRPRPRPMAQFVAEAIATAPRPRRLAHCPTCGDLVRSIFSHVDGCPKKKPRQPLRKVSKKKASWNAKYSRAKAERKAAQIREKGHTYCERCLRPCDPDGHHPGGQVGKRILVFFLSCRECHDWGHFGDPKAARAEGWVT